MSKTKTNIKPRTIMFDYGRKEDVEDGKGVVLLFDAKRQCYYEVTLAHILGVVNKKFEAYKSDLDNRFATLSADVKEDTASLKKEQKQFISETAKVTNTILDLVKGGSKND